TTLVRHGRFVARSSGGPPGPLALDPRAVEGAAAGLNDPPHGLPDRVGATAVGLGAAGDVGLGAAGDVGLGAARDVGLGGGRQLGAIIAAGDGGAAGGG